MSLYESLKEIFKKKYRCKTCGKKLDGNWWMSYSDAQTGKIIKVQCVKCGNNRGW